MGVVYHTHYLVWCEIARTDFIRQFDVTYAQLERDGLLLAVAEAQVRYIGSARYDDLIAVTARLDRVQSRLLTFAYEIFREEAGSKQLLATAVTKLIALDRNATPRQLPQDLIAKFKDVQVIPT
jgi:acyl-CoA thioester hydrolase